MVHADAKALHVDPRAADVSPGQEPTASPEWQQDSKPSLLARSPAQNWFWESSLESLFLLSGLVHVLLPFDVPALNKFVAQVPPFRLRSLYRTYTLRRCHVCRNGGATDRALLLPMLLLPAARKIEFA